MISIWFWIQSLKVENLRILEWDTLEFRGHIEQYSYIDLTIMDKLDLTDHWEVCHSICFWAAKPIRCPKVYLKMGHFRLLRAVIIKLRHIEHQFFFIWPKQTNLNLQTISRSVAGQFCEQLSRLDIQRHVLTKVNT